MPTTETAVFAGGCFWCTEAIFERLRGVASVTSGYTGGAVPDPSYGAVSSGATGHAEAIKVEFDPARIAYRDLLNVFFGTHDPTTLNRQGHDAGTQYRSAVFAASDAQRAEAEAFIAELGRDRAFGDAPIVTEVRMLERFYPAEGYHQKYYDNNAEQPYCQAVIDPKLASLRRKFAPLLKP